MDRSSIGALIAGRLRAASPEAAEAYAQSGPIGYFVVDELLPPDLAARIASAFPDRDALVEKNTARERKFVSSQMDRHASLVEEALFAFQAPQVLAAVQAIVARDDLRADPMLYAGGVSRMEAGGYLNPHIDNSHDKERRRWRALNLLYYVSPGWRAHYGGNLELWPNGVRDAAVTVESRFNRLVVMATHQRSWHSVSPIHADRPRNCISNYYFADRPMREDQPFHVTSFRGRPEQPATDLLLRADAGLRGLIRRIKPGGAFKTGHWYEKKDVGQN